MSALIWKCIRLVAAVLAAAASVSAAGGIAFRRLAIPDDVPAHLCTALAQDRDGFIWIGTQGGLVRYDGYTFRLYRSDPSDETTLGGSYVRTIHVGYDGRIWVGTYSGGVSVLDPTTGKFQRYRRDPQSPDSLSADDVEAVAEDAAGRVWIATDKGLDRLTPNGHPPDGQGRLTPSGQTPSGQPAGGHFDHFHANPGDPSALADDRVRALLVDRSGRVWVGSRGGLQLWNEANQGFDRVASNPGAPGSLAGQLVSRIFEDSRGRIWVGTTESGAAVIDGRSGALIRRLEPQPKAPAGLSHFWVYGIAEVGSEVWVATYGGGVDVLDADSLEIVDRLRHDSSLDDTLGGDRVGAILRDRSGVVWIGTWGQGIAMHDPATRAFTTLRYSPTRPDGLTHPAAVRTLERNDGTIWVGTNGNGIDVLDPSGRLVGGYRPDSSHRGALSDGSVTCLAQAPDGTTWVATLDGVLHRLRPGASAFDRFTADDGLPRGPIRAMTFGPDGALWVGAAEGLGRIDVATSAITSFHHDAGDDASLSGNAVEAIAFGRDGTLWVGTSAGLNAFDPSSGRAVHVLHEEGRPDSLPNDWVPDLMVASDGRLWVATQAGACVLTAWNGRTAQFDAVAARLGRAPAPVDSIVEDAEGRVWLGPRLRIDPKSWEAREFGPADGCAFRTFFIASRTRATDGRLLFGSPEGLLVVHPEKIEPWTYAPPVVVTAIRIDGVETEAPSAPNWADSVRDVRLPAEIVLTPSQRGFSVDFAALDFTGPQRNLYRYRLDGYDADWVSADASRRSATYTGLPPGTYRLHVQGTNRAGLWSPDELDITVTVLPAFYQTAWFRALALLAVVGLAYAAYRWRVRRLSARGRELERIVAERTTALADAVERISESERQALEMKDEAVAAREEAIEASRAKSVFLANMSHELRTPLNAVLGFAQLLVRSPRLDHEDRESLDVIHRSGEHLLGLINDVLSISKIEAGKLTLTEAPFDLPALLHAVRAIVQVRAETKGLAVVFETQSDLPRAVTGDEGKLRQVLINLLGNAVKFTDRGRVVLRTRWADGRAHFEIEDTGQGISEEEIGKLFETFGQTESGRKSKEGTGLGLVISRQIVNLMGGDVSVRSRVGEGTTFAFDANLPAADGVRALRESRRAIGLAASPFERPPRVLVVDDTEENRMLLVKLLGPVGFETREASNGAEAVDVWRAWSPDLVFMDMRMPVMDGREATRRIRSEEAERREATAGDSPSPGEPRPARCRIVALTASAFEHERDEILSHGADDFVAKPFREDALFEKLAEHLGVRYAYEEPDAKPAAGAREAGLLTPARLATLPADRIGELYDALTHGDFEAAAAVAERVREADEPLGTALLGEIRAFRLDELLSVIERLERVT